MADTTQDVCEVCGWRNPRCTFGHPRGLCGCWREYQGAQPCSRKDDPTEHDAPRYWGCPQCGAILTGERITERAADHGREHSTDAAWSRDRDDHDAAVDHFVRSDPHRDWYRTDSGLRRYR